MSTVEILLLRMAETTNVVKHEAHKAITVLIVVNNCCSSPTPAVAPLKLNKKKKPLKKKVRLTES